MCMRACMCACRIGRPSSTFLHLVHSRTGIGVTHSHGETLHGSHACGMHTGHKPTLVHWCHSQPVPRPCQVRMRRLTACALEAPPTTSVPSTHYLGSAHWTCRKPASRPAGSTWESLALGWLTVRKTPRPQLPISIWGMGPGGGGGGWTLWAQKVGRQWSRPGIFPGELAPLPALTWVSLRRGPSTQQGHLLLTWDQQAMELCPLDVVGPLP